jgi:hypothetical protein
VHDALTGATVTVTVCTTVTVTATQDGTDIPLTKETSQRRGATVSFSRRTGGDDSKKQPDKGEYPKATLAALCSSPPQGWARGLECLNYVWKIVGMPGGPPLHLWLLMLHGGLCITR